MKSTTSNKIGAIRAARRAVSLINSMRLRFRWSRCSRGSTAGVKGARGSTSGDRWRVQSNSAQISSSAKGRSKYWLKVQGCAALRMRRRFIDMDAIEQYSLYFAGFVAVANSSEVYKLPLRDHLFKDFYSVTKSD